MSEHAELPSRFQLGEQVRVGSRRGRVTGVLFALSDFNDGWGEGGKIYYDVEGVGRCIVSNDVGPVPQLVVDAALNQRGGGE